MKPSVGLSEPFPAGVVRKKRSVPAPSMSGPRTRS